MSNSKIQTFIFGVLLLLGSPVFAGKDAGAGNGGDICEDRFKIVRDDITSWIKKGGHLWLQLPNGLDAKGYEESMLNAISQAKLSCTDEVLTIGGAEKTCKNFVVHGSFRILCNATRYLNTDESSQYVLVHHEYAGLSGIEINNGEDSNYSVSNQISGFLADEVVKKLAVVVTPPIQPPVSCVALDRSKPIPVGVRCITSTGTIFERVTRDNFGEAWRGPDGLVWSSVVGKGDQYTALELCKDLGGTLPSKIEFERASANGFEEPFRIAMGSSCWTSTIHPNDSSYAYYFYPSPFGNSFHAASRLYSDYYYNYLGIRCVGR